jgi:Ca2+-transporting ATPase
MSNSDWHRVYCDAALARLQSSNDGLSTAQAQRRLAEHGPNRLPEGRRRTLFGMLLHQFADFMILVLLAAALISGIVGEPQDTVTILVIVLLNAVIGLLQEYRAERAVAALRQMTTPTTRVMRDGLLVTLSSVELVPGDVVLLEAGDAVPADLRLLEATELQADESALTGESHPVDKDTVPLDAADPPLGDRTNMAFRGSTVTHGRGSGVVVATGSDTELGHIAEMLSGEAGVKTPLQVRLARFGRYLALAVLAICAIVFAAGLLQGQPVMLMLLTAISLAVAAIPEACRRWSPSRWLSGRAN